MSADRYLGLRDKEVQDSDGFVYKSRGYRALVFIPEKGGSWVDLLGT